MSEVPTNDTVVRAITQDGAFRVIAALTTATVRGAAQAQSARGDVAQSFGELLTGAILIREAMAPRLRVQAILKAGDGGGNMVADSHPDGTSRGLVRFGAGKGAARAVGAGSLLQVMRTLPSGSLHQGVVAVPEGGGISGAFMSYMQDSEQIVSTIAVSTVVSDGEVVAAGGYMVQLLPEIERGPLMIMTERLAALENLGDVLQKSDLTPDALLHELLYGMPFTRLEESRLDFGCGCSQVRVMTSLATLPRSDIEELLRDNEVLEINCDYCGKDYRIAPAQLRALLTPS
ncbi:MAG: Hsp33 family molecular chaperone HslO [Minicystis sp.]